MRWILITITTLLVATCGQKGPLTVPEKQTFAYREQAETEQGIAARHSVSDDSYG